MPTYLDILISIGVDAGCSRPELMRNVSRQLQVDPAFRQFMSTSHGSSNIAKIDALEAVEHWLTQHERVGAALGIHNQVQQIRAAHRFVTERDVVALSYPTAADMRKILINNGRKYWWSYKDTDDDLSAAMRKVVRVEEEIAPHMAVELLACLQLPEYMLPIILSILWAHHAYPEIQLGEKEAAALMLQDHPNPIVPPPWAGLFINIPRGLLHTLEQGTDIRRDIYGVLVGRHMHRYSGAFERQIAWSYLIFSDRGPYLFKYFQPEEDLLNDDGGRLNMLHIDKHRYAADDLDARTFMVVRRLILNLCQQAAVKPLTPIGKHAPGWTSGPGAHVGYPATRVFALAKEPDAEDLRPVLKAFLAGARSTS